MRIARASIWILVIPALVVACGYKTNPRPSTATVPAEVGLVHAHAYPAKIVLRWDVPKTNVDGSPLKDISGFKVYKTTEKIGEECENCPEQKAVPINVDFQHPVNAVIAEGEVVFTDPDVKLGDVYTYSVTVYNLKGREGHPSEDVTVVFDEPPPEPKEPQATVEKRGIRLEWTAPVRPAGLRSYSIFRGTEPQVEKMKSVGRTKWAETYFVDETVEPHTTYYYVVRSLKMNRGVPFDSEPSPVVKVVVPSLRVKSPENVTVASTRGGIRVYWDRVNIEGSETLYNVYRSESRGVFIKLNSEPIVSPGYVDKTVRRGYTYRYAVTAFPKETPEEESSRSASEAVRYNR